MNEFYVAAIFGWLVMALYTYGGMYTLLNDAQSYVLAQWYTRLIMHIVLAVVCIAVWPFVLGRWRIL